MKRIIIILALTFAVIGAVQSSKCGVAAKGVSLIVRGNDFSRGKWPWMVALVLRAKNRNGFFCGGVLISQVRSRL